MSDLVRHLIEKNRHEFSEQANHLLMHEQYYRLFPDRAPLPLPPQQQRGANGRYTRSKPEHHPTKAELQERKEREEKHESRLAALEERMRGGGATKKKADAAQASTSDAPPPDGAN